MKVKIFETSESWDNDGYDYACQVILEGYTNWDEVSEQEYKELRQFTIDWNNKYRYEHNLNKLFIIRELDLQDTKNKSVEFYKQKIKEQKEKEEKAKIKAEESKKKKEKTELSRKKKQLEKLAKELQVKVVE